MNADSGFANDMNFELPEEIRMLKDTVRKFVDKEMIPIERTGRDGHKLKPEVRADLERRPRRWGSTATTCRRNTAARASA